MAEQFYTILTKIGKAKIANASALGTKIDFTNFALGDGGGSYYNPIESQTSLKREVWRGKIGNVAIDENNPNWIVLENIIPSSIGGFMIREAGVFDDEGNLIAIGKYPETYKPVVENGSAKDLIIKMILEVSNTSAVTLKIDPTIILATKKDIDILSNRIKKNEDDIKELKQGSTIMEDLQTENKTLVGSINEALDKSNQAFQSASDGKQVIATAITGKGVPTSSSDTFQKMATNIDAIETDPSIGTTNAVAEDILSPKKVISQGKLLTGTIPSKGAATITPTTSPQTIAANQYLSGAQTIAGVSVPVANVLAGVTIAGAVGTMPNRGALNQTITTNNGQVNLPDGYYTGGVIKAIFANLIASNIRDKVNVGGVVGTLVERKFAKGIIFTDSTGACTVTGLGFMPKVINISSIDGLMMKRCTIVNKDWTPNTAYVMMENFSSGNYTFGDSTDSKYYVINGSFKLPTSILSTNVNWFATE